MKDEERFPFDCIIVTSPDDKSAKSAEGPLRDVLEKRLRKLYPSQTVRIVSTYDPFGARCGSGGGTLAALELASWGMSSSSSERENVMILHAGGDSSRCPTQMIVGKAWTNIPCSHYRNPTIWLIEQVQRLFEKAKFPRGTCVVVATDCLCTCFDKGLTPDEVQWDYQYTDESVVLGVAVPAPVTTAKNHGVYIMSEKIVKSSYVIGIEDPLDVWQKPTVEKLLTTEKPAPSSFVLPTRPEEKQAWIDTGLVVFLPKAVDTLKDMSSNILSLCTRKGLEDAYEKSQKSQPSEQTVENFARENALKIDLYTDILHNLSWPTQQKDKESSPLRKALSQLPLQILIAPQGRFLHLGTTQELVEFVTSGAFPLASEKMNRDRRSTGNTIVALSEYFSLQPRYQCWKTPSPLQHNVALQSTFPEETRFGQSSFVEYCDLKQYKSVNIGDNAMLSGWRNSHPDDTSSMSKSSLDIPSNICVQLLETKDGGDSYSLMVLGIGDPIKADWKEGTIYGLPIQDFLDKSGMTMEEIGWKGGNDKNNNLWNAKIHPIITRGTTFESVFGWVQTLLDDPNAVTKDILATDPTFQAWMSSSRSSLKQLHSLADAGKEWAFRQSMEEKILELEKEEFIPHMERLLHERVHDQPLDLGWILDMDDQNAATTIILKILNSLEKVARSEMEKGSYDICGRAFMIASTLLADYDVLQAHGSTDEAKDDNLPKAITDFCKSHIDHLRADSTRQISKPNQLKALDEITKHRGSKMTADNLKNCSGAYTQVMEQLSFCMNELCIAQGFHQLRDASTGEGITSKKRVSPAILGKWVMAKAPARVDLAGAWSDTPPVSYEFGGSVTGFAATVDGLMPLSCRTRITKGGRGMLLRSEIRDSRTCSLTKSAQAQINSISDLASFRDPTSECALLKSALVCLGLASQQEIDANADLAGLLKSFCGVDFDVGFEIVTVSLLPQGSGLGTSSILGSCILASLAKCIGMNELSDDSQLHAVLMLEQLLSSGGGWQDQAHGIVPGFKTVTSKPAQVPLDMSIEKLDIKPEILAAIEDRLILAFTGQTRLAKNILQNVLRRWSRRTDEILNAVGKLIEASNATKAAILNGNVEALAEAIYESFKLKVVMTGEESGAVPPAVGKLIADLMHAKKICGASLCGACGGGFLIMVAADGYNAKKVERYVKDELLESNTALESFTWHDCTVCKQGLTTYTIENDNGYDKPDSFCLDWHKKDSTTPTTTNGHDEPDKKKTRLE